MTQVKVDEPADHSISDCNPLFHDNNTLKAFYHNAQELKALKGRMLGGL